MSGRAASGSDSPPRLPLPTSVTVPSLAYSYDLQPEPEPERRPLINPYDDDHDRMEHEALNGGGGGYDDPDATLTGASRGGSGSGALPKGAMPPAQRTSDGAVYQSIAPDSPLTPNRRPPSSASGTNGHPASLRAGNGTVNAGTTSPLSPNRRQPSPYDTPTASPLPSPGLGHVQFATYPEDGANGLRPGYSRSSTEEKWKKEDPGTPPAAFESWTPVPLRPWFWITFACVMVGVAIGLEVALSISKKRNGWAVSRDFSATDAGWWHYAYTLPPVFVAGLFVALWTWTDVEVKKLQPYVDLVRGESKPQHSILLDYTRVNNFLMPAKAIVNKHYLVMLASLMSLMLLTFQPLAAALFEIRDTQWTTFENKLTTGLIGLNQSAQFADLSVFLSAAGYASAAALYDLEPPPFITKDGYTVAPFELPTDIASNGTARVNATAVQSDPGCQFAQVSMVQFNDSDGVLFWNNSASFNGCTFSWNVSRLADHLFGTDLVQDCQQDTPSQFQPLVFWFFTYLPKPAASISFCTPSIHLRSVLVDVSIADGNVTALRDVGPLAGNFSSLAANVSSLAGAYNGISFPFVNDTTDPFVLERGNATRFVLPAAIFQAAQTSPQGLTATFSTDGFLGLSTSVYRTFLALVAKSVYFLSAQEPIYMEVLTIKKRLFLSDVAVHLLAAALFILAIFSTSLQFLHRGEREELRLAHKPGTIASAMSIGGRSTVGELLDGRQREEDIVQALRDKRFRIDPRTMKIVMQGEEGYESASTPRKSVFESLSVPAGKISNRFSKRFSTSKTTPLPPSTP